MNRVVHEQCVSVLKLWHTQHVFRCPPVEKSNRSSVEVYADLSIIDVNLNQDLLRRVD